MFALAATLGANIQIHLSARRSGSIGKKVASRITPMLRCMAVTSLHRTKSRNPPRIHDFAISREGAGCRAPDVNHGYHLNMRLIEDKPHKKNHITILYLLFCVNSVS